ncbi:uncharacterized protein MYCGRDRAFT_46756 [Zymoseptoria tritici IPO323]|uniref:Ubiquitin-like domain-containing protein n=1 Tax=Zymoseptoria tritici (strain CBS 115943 / IPO323) TaxID=336722 RepID=F9XIB2_ZYMTI|nr:uncharacterized protein MYCGRDRAFT_46756 [Zymoseptoria tritici IPO323]EGP85292.1 hypothetical protein MYCGRDRAFT_46756 [Zymoseptoria tritici IPO323]
MSEVTFAKQFLATLDKRPIKLPADHISDPRQYPNQSPSILPRATHPFPRKTGPTATQTAATTSLTVTLKPMRGPASDSLSLTNISLTSTIYDIKTLYAQKTGLQAEKVKLLLNKKPAADLKTLKDLGVTDSVKDVELSVMVMGGGGAAGGSTAGTPRDQSPKAAVAAESQAAPKKEGDGADEILATEEFWDDLKGFLSQRLRNEEVGAKLSQTFRAAWKK